MTGWMISIIFIASLLFIFSVYTLFFAERMVVRRRLFQEEKGNRSAEQKVEEIEQLESEREYRSFMTRIQDSRFYRSLLVRIQQSHVKIRPEEYVLVSFVSALVVFAFVFLLNFSPLLSFVISLLGLFIPRYYLRAQARKRQKELNKQLPQALNLLANGLRAGFSFTQALNVASRDLGDPISEEFSKILRDNRLGKSLEAALENFAERNPHPDIEMLTTAVFIQRQVGGNLADILDSLAKTIRERMQLQAEIKTMTAQGRISAWVVGLLPFAMGAVLYLMNPEYMSVLFTTTIGLLLVSGALVILITGIFILVRMVDMKV
ncbi:type II secretion system F family protein [Lacticigenium naphthae]|uniref:type II secretion system F family protein n=1 Tax=Lacticigenium naphthae TaxID=515351 RepID=UPI0003F5C065|nr:type II secretion system F family protein [Lacticigenium naphthae]